MTNSISVPGAATQASGFPNVIRLIRWYEKVGDQLIGEFVLQNTSLAELQTWFGESAANPMYDCYPITALQASHLQQKLNQRLDLDQYSYYLECDAAGELSR